MPTYDYQCKVCNHTFETFQSISDKPLKKCPVCDGSVKRLISPGAGLIFKGSGFYITDYKKNEKKKSEEKAKGEESKGEKEDSSKKQDEGGKKNSSTKKD